MALIAAVVVRDARNQKIAKNKKQAELAFDSDVTQKNMVTEAGKFRANSYKK